MKMKKEMPLWAQTGHSKPTTRREFLAHGMIPFAASLMAPQFLNLILSSVANAQAAVVCNGVTAKWIPFVSLNLSGGAAMASNFVPMKSNGDRLASYSKMGLGDNQVPLVQEFGGANFAGSNGNLIGKMLEGIRSVASTDTLSNTSFIGVCVRSRDDSGENPFSINGLVTKAGLLGSHLPNLGAQSTITGVNQKPAYITPPTPLVVRSFRDILNSLGYSAALGSQLSNTQKIKLAQLVSKLSESQARKLASVTTGDQIHNLVACAGIKNEELIQEGSSVVDPVKNSTFANIWQLNANSQQNSNNYVFGSMVYNALMGFAGATSLEMGGFDYHNNTRNTGDNRDREAGVAMGRILQSANVLQQPLFLYVTSDGAVVSAESTARNSPWTSDRGSAGAAYIFIYDPKGRPAVSNHQIGSFTDDQVADDKFVTGNDPARAAQAVFANYLQFNKRLGDLQKVVGRNALETSALNQVVKIV